MGRPTIKDPSVELIEVDGTGVGMRATTDIKAGTLLVAEPPLFPAPQDPVTTQGLETHILLELGFLEKDDQLAFWNLKNSWQGMKSEAIGTWETNAMPVQGTQSAIFPLCSRYNHSCTAQAAYSWSEEMQLQMIYSSKDIKAGEQVCVGYFGRDMMRLSTDDRQKLILDVMNFTCLCDTCSNTGFEAGLSDLRRIEIGNLTRMLRVRNDSIADDRSALQYCHRALALSVKEGAGAQDIDAIYFEAFRIHGENSDWARASAFASLWVKTMRIWRGTTCPQVAKYLKYVTAPETYKDAGVWDDWTTNVKDAMSEDSPGFEEWLWRRADGGDHEMSG